MTELGFLAHLLTKHELPPDTKEFVAARLVEVAEACEHLRPAPWMTHPQAQTQLPTGVPQAASTLAIMARNPDLVPPPAPVPVEQIAQTAATQAALASRSAAMMGVTDPNTGRKRKF